MTTVDVRFALFEGGGIALAESPVAEGSDTKTEPIRLFPIPDDEEESFPLRAMRFSAAKRLPVEEGTVRFSVGSGDDAASSHSLRVRESTRQILVLLLRKPSGHETYAIELESPLRPDQVVSKNFTDSDLILRMADEDIRLGPLSHEVRTVPDPSRATLKVAVKRKEGGRWRFIYASSLGGSADDALLLAIYPTPGGPRLARLLLPLE
jgi:hypothetical protein